MADAVDGMFLVTRFSPNHRLSCHLQWTPFMDGYHFCYLKFHSTSVHDDSIKFVLNRTDNELSLKIIVPSSFDRTGEEFHLNGPTNVHSAPCTKTSDNIFED
jgi:hypothetical protein